MGIDAKSHPKEKGPCPDMQAMKAWLLILHLTAHHASPGYDCSICQASEYSISYFLRFTNVDPSLGSSFSLCHRPQGPSCLRSQTVVTPSTARPTRTLLRTLAFLPTHADCGTVSADTHAVSVFPGYSAWRYSRCCIHLCHVGGKAS